MDKPKTKSVKMKVLVFSFIWIVAFTLTPLLVVGYPVFDKEWKEMMEWNYGLGAPPGYMFRATMTQDEITARSIVLGVRHGADTARVGFVSGILSLLFLLSSLLAFRKFRKK